MSARVSVGTVAVAVNLAVELRGVFKANKHHKEMVAASIKLKLFMYQWVLAVK